MLRANQTKATEFLYGWAFRKSNNIRNLLNNDFSQSVSLPKAALKEYNERKNLILEDKKSFDSETDKVKQNDFALKIKADFKYLDIECNAIDQYEHAMNILTKSINDLQEKIDAIKPKLLKVRQYDDKNIFEQFNLAMNRYYNVKKRIDLFDHSHPNKDILPGLIENYQNEISLKDTKMKSFQKANKEINTALGNNALNQQKKEQLEHDKATNSREIHALKNQIDLLKVHISNDTDPIQDRKGLIIEKHDLYEILKQKRASGEQLKKESLIKLEKYYKSVKQAPELPPTPDTVLSKDTKIDIDADLTHDQKSSGFTPHTARIATDSHTLATQENKNPNNTQSSSTSNDETTESETAPDLPSGVFSFLASVSKTIGRFFNALFSSITRWIPKFF
ncbi:hypothetical protein IPH25_02025 [bacterium]|nr:MAG: hypothetical protein IPG37_04155 [bacterium]QQR62202.1 MAG: hypothetical protein IPH25_02025 [bacterium]